MLSQKLDYLLACLVFNGNEFDLLLQLISELITLINWTLELVCVLIIYNI